MERKHTINIGNKTLGVVSEFTGTVYECLSEIENLEVKHETTLQHYEVGTGWRIIGSVFQKPN